VYGKKNKKYNSSVKHLPNTFREKNAEYKAKQKDNFDIRHKVGDSLVLPDNTEVLVTTGGTGAEPVHGTFTTGTGSPRTYIVEVPSGET